MYGVNFGAMLIMHFKHALCGLGIRKSFAAVCKIRNIFVSVFTTTTKSVKDLQLIKQFSYAVIIIL